MSRQVVIAFASMLFWTAGTAHAQESELETRTKIATDVRRAFFAKNVDALEALAKQYRTEKSRTSSGLWKLTMFYSGVKAVVDTMSDNDKRRAALAFVNDVDGRWQKAYPDSPAAQVARGVVLVASAWKIRGPGPNSDVPPQAWEPFRQGIEEARVYLESVKASASTDPAWYCEMASVAKVQHWPREKFNAFAGELLARHPAYYQAVFCAGEYLAPQWHFEGAGAIEAFTDQAVAATHKEEGKSLYARIYWALDAGNANPQVLGENFRAWPKMRAGFNDVIARYPDAWNLNHFAKYSCLVRDWEQFAKLAGRIGKAPQQGVMEQKFYDRCKAPAAKLGYRVALIPATVSRRLARSGIIGAEKGRRLL